MGGVKIVYGRPCISVCYPDLLGLRESTINCSQAGLASADRTVRWTGGSAYVVRMMISGCVAAFSTLGFAHMYNTVSQFSPCVGEVASKLCDALFIL